MCSLGGLIDSSDICKLAQREHHGPRNGLWNKDKKGGREKTNKALPVEDELGEAAAMMARSGQIVELNRFPKIDSSRCY